MHHLSQTSALTPDFDRKRQVFYGYKILWKPLTMFTGIFVNVLRSMSSREKWINWTHLYSFTVKLSFIINGSSKGSFATQKGSRQGDPVTPFLFTLIMEDQSRMFPAAWLQGWINDFNPSQEDQGEMYLTRWFSGFLWGREGIDSLVARDTSVLWRSVWPLYQLFQECSLSSKRCLKSTGNCWYFGYILGSFPTTYLGPPLGAKSKSTTIWNGILEKCKRELSCWRRKSLSWSVFINNVLNILSPYTMSLFPLPLAVAQKMDKPCKKFQW